MKTSRTRSNSRHCCRLSLTKLQRNCTIQISSLPISANYIKQLNCKIDCKLIGASLLGDFPQFTLYLHCGSILNNNIKNRDHEPRRCRPHRRRVEATGPSHSAEPTGDAHQRQEEEAVAEVVSILTSANRFSNLDWKAKSSTSTD